VTRGGGGRTARDARHACPRGGARRHARPAPRRGPDRLPRVARGPPALRSAAYAPCS
jgi:hypothetical protein